MATLDCERGAAPGHSKVAHEEEGEKQQQPQQRAKEEESATAPLAVTDGLFRHSEAPAQRPSLHGLHGKHLFEALSVVGLIAGIAAVGAALPLTVPLAGFPALFRGDAQRSEHISFWYYVAFQCVYALLALGPICMMPLLVFPRAVLNVKLLAIVLPSVTVVSLVLLYPLVHCGPGDSSHAVTALVGVNVPVVYMTIGQFIVCWRLRGLDCEKAYRKAVTLGAEGTLGSVHAYSECDRMPKDDSSMARQSSVELLRASVAALLNPGEGSFSIEPAPSYPNKTAAAATAAAATDSAHSHRKFSKKNPQATVLQKPLISSPANSSDVIVGDGVHGGGGVNALTLSPYYAQTDAEERLGLAAVEPGPINLRNGSWDWLSLWLLLLLRDILITCLYFSMQGMTRLFATFGQHKPAWCFFAFCAVAHSFRIVIKAVARQIDRLRAYGISTEYAVDVLVYSFIFMFYINLFSVIESYKAFFTVKALSVLGEVFLYPVRMSPWYYRVHRHFVGRDDWLGAAYKTVTLEVSAPLLLNRLCLEMSMRLCFSVISSVLFVLTWCEIRFGYNRNYFETYNVSELHFERTMIFTMIALAISVAQGVFAYSFVVHQLHFPFLGAWISLFRLHFKSYLLLWIACLVHINHDIYLARLKVNKLSERACW